MSKVLIFDLGGVLIENAMFEEFPKMTAERLSGNALKARLLQSPAFRQFELGQCSTDEFAAAMLEEFALNVSEQEFVAAFSGWPSGFSAGAVELLGELRNRHTVCCLSNSNELHWTDRVTSHFDRSYSSHQLNMIKPDANVFEFVTSDLGCRPHDIIYFDDAQLNVDAACDYGWDAHLADGYEGLLRVLDEIGIA
ncbi:MAG: HAD-IA family hydrolase [Pseudomonadaceae bacterium]|nr:HAD-IA family hydrolase [Pseudomonadaceae bacterium]